MQRGRLARAVASAAALGSVLGAAPVSAIDGALDPTFGTAGVVTTALGDSDDDAGVEAVAIQGDGKIVAAGFFLVPGDPNGFALARYEADGAPDASFGTGGVVTTSLGVSFVLTALLLQPDGRIVAVGYTVTGGGTFALVRYESDGSLDATFGTGGIVTTTATSGGEAAFTAALQSDGKIVLAGRVGREFALARYATDGSFDPGFGTAGAVTTDVSGNPNIYAEVRDLAVQSDGKLVAGGNISAGNFGEFAVARYHPDGTLDTTFGAGGVVIGPVDPDRHDALRGIALQADGRIVAAGSSFGTSQSVVPAVARLARYAPDGSIDGTFGEGGVVVTTRGDNYQVEEVALQDDGKIVTVGTTAATTWDITLARYAPDGSLDPLFGSGGTTAAAVDDVAQGTSTAIDTDGRIVAAGRGVSNGELKSVFVLTRHLTSCGNGVVDPGEQCDDGAAQAGDCCTATCEYAVAQSSCAGDGDSTTCDLCDGSGACTHPACEDHPVSGLKLVLKRSSSGKEKLAFVSKDPAAPFPAPADAPTLVGGQVEILSASEGASAFALPASHPASSWSVNAAGTAYKFSNKRAPAGPSGVKVVALKQATVLKVAGKHAGLPLAGAHGTVSVRVTTGGVRTCAVFTAPTVVRDEPDVFIAKNAPAPAIAGCSDDDLL